MNKMVNRFKTANGAFDYYYKLLNSDGVEFDNTKALFNIGFYIFDPLDNDIDVDYRKWSKKYADAEWEWYNSEDKNISKLGEIYGKIPAIWLNMADENGDVNSNYGWQWAREDQLNKVVEKLRTKPDTRKAVISIYDGKEIKNYQHDTPCTYGVQFTILDNKLNMTVLMRSNDIWYGFCNDQYQFSLLQKKVADMLSIDVGWYYHFAQNLHVYKDKLNKS